MARSIISGTGIRVSGNSKKIGLKNNPISEESRSAGAPRPVEPAHRSVGGLACCEVLLHRFVQDVHDVWGGVVQTGLFSSPLPNPVIECNFSRWGRGIS